MTDSLALPPAFESLRPHLGWALPTSNERSNKRRHSSPEELKSFYEAMLPLADEALTYLDTFTLAELPDSAQPLFQLTLSLAEVAPYVEWFRGASVSPSAGDFEHRLKIASEPA